MKCKKCLQEKSNEDFLTYYKSNNIMYSYKVCKECYSNVHRMRMLGTHPSIEVIEKMAAKKRGIKQSPELIAKRVSKLIGQKRTKQQKENISKSLLGRKLSEEHKKATGQGHLGLKHSPEHCANISKSNIGKHNSKRNEIQRQHISEGTKKGMSPPEIRQQCADRQRRLLALNIYKTPKTTEENMLRILTEHFHLVEGKDFKHSYYMGLPHPHVVDFYIYSHKLVIECDGDYWHTLPKNIAKDKLHNKEMDEANISWIRFTETQLTKKEEEVIKILSTRLNLVEVTHHG